MEKKEIVLHKVLFEVIAEIMKLTFPYYESDDLDDYIYLVKGQHINSATMRIIEHLEKGKIL